MTAEPWRRPGVIEHSQCLLDSYARLLGHELLPRDGPPEEQSRRLYDAPFVVLSHGVEADPILNFGNAAALALWEADLPTFTSMPSRLTAEAPRREERARLLERVSRDGFIDDYSGIRISSTGKRFFIERATVWNLFDRDGRPAGQAATFSEWRHLDA
ncbi:MAG: MEKHLA domain-containing protein [Planctomycetota bacterium]|nr:MEKHLA domain-containing protein [Planctomycetaceae bacterium]MDQ3329147.1 MEKHLA domain-containing protein [Planctomycetota bacterium]